MSMDANTATESEGLMDCETKPDVDTKDQGPAMHVDTVHLMIRQALVDWGDYMMDTLAESFKNDDRVLKALEKTREDIIDPMRLECE